MAFKNKNNQIINFNMNELNVEILYGLFNDMNNEIFGFGTIKRYYNLTKNQINFLKNEFYKVYDRDHEIFKILNKKRAIFVGKKLSIKLKGQQIAPNSQQQRTESVRKFWKDNENTEYGLQLREQSRKSMLELWNKNIPQLPENIKKRTESRLRNCGGKLTPEHCKKISISQIGKFVPIETRQKQSTAAKLKYQNGYARPNFKHTDETKLLLSEKTKKLWESGIFSNNKFFTSKGQIEIFDLVNDIIFPDFLVELNKMKYAKSWDVFIDECKLIIEYNGTYWHYDPRKYNFDFVDTSRNLVAIDVWSKDAEKAQIAINNNYKFIVIWQLDWEALPNIDDKINFLKNKINEQFS
jgi:hypothetical protein